MLGQLILEPAVLAGIVSVVVSLILSYVPSLRVWFAGIQRQFKSLIMLGILALVSVTIWVAGGLGLLAINIPFDQQGFVGLVKVFLVTVMANQATYLLSPEPVDVKLAKNIRDVVAKEVAPATPAIKAEAASIVSEK
jgi:energy-converting hydrogenase Eha subunit C